MTAFSFRVRAGSIPLYWEIKAIGAILCLKLKQIVYAKFVPVSSLNPLLLYSPPICL